MTNQKNKNAKTIVVTGIGIISPIGNNVKSFWDNLIAGKSGIGPMKLADPSNFPCKISGESQDFDPFDFINSKEVKRMARFSQFAIAAASQAIENAKLEINAKNSFEIGVILGNGYGGLPNMEEGCNELLNQDNIRVSPLFFPMILPNMAAANISRTFGFRGYNSTVSTACAASNQAIGEALEVLRRGDAEVMLAGGTEAGISQIGNAGFCAMRALSISNSIPEKASRPFDLKRDGFVPSEGSGILVLETLEHAKRRKAKILCEISGFGSTSDAYHIVQPDVESLGAKKAILFALNNANIEINDIDYINAHGTSTPLNDRLETKAIKEAFKYIAYDIPVSSTKSMIGHSLGAAGSLEAVACVQTLLAQEIHPTINQEFPDPECDLNYVPNHSILKNIRHILSNAFGFGGQNACLVFSAFD